MSAFLDVSESLTGRRWVGPSLEEDRLAEAMARDIRIDRVAGDRFEGRIAGARDLHIGKVEVGSFTLAIAGAGNATAESGRARSVDYSIAGAGDIRAQGVSSETAAVSVQGAGGVRLQASKTASVSVMGAGDVAYLRTVTIGSAVAGFLPLSLVAGPLDWGLAGVWTGLCLFIALRLVGVLARVAGDRWLEAPDTVRA